MSELNREVVDFIQDEIDTVPHLEALLLLWTTRPRVWTAEDMAKAIFVDFATGQKVLQDLVRQGLAGTPSADSFTYALGNPEKDKLIAATDEVYRRNLVRIARMIHSKTAAPVREYARAFRFRKDQ